MNGVPRDRRALAALGISLLYASTYLLKLAPASRSTLYFGDFSWRAVLTPTVTVVVLLTTVSMAGAAGLSRLPPSRARRLLLLASLALWYWIAYSAIIVAAGLQLSRPLKLTLGSLAAGAFAWYCGASARRVASAFRLLSSLGYALTVLAGVRLGSFPIDASEPRPAAQSTITASATPSVSEHTTAGARRVIWLVFDELDLRRVFQRGHADVGLMNFRRLASMSVHATHANTPSNATLSSIPALLLGRPISGYRVAGRFAMDMVDREGTAVRFDEEHSLLAQLPGGPDSAAILGYYHPYCDVFPHSHCERSASGSTHDWVEAASAPFGFLHEWYEERPAWGRITRDALERLPHVIDGGHALTFVHLNVPHLPASYAHPNDGLPRPLDSAEEYDRNLALADQILGRVLTQLAGVGPGESVLLIVTSDHWWRHASPRVAQPVPLMMWIVGDNAGRVIDRPVSTIHTGELVLDFLRGRVRSQAEVERWWHDKEICETWFQQ